MFGQNTGIRIGGPITPVVKNLMIINGVIFLIQQVISLKYPGLVEGIGGLSHLGLFHKFMLWQVVTYMFLHGGWMHIIFNLIGLWMFAGELEQVWGSKLFLRYYLLSGIGAGFFIALMNFFIFVNYSINPVTIGASGAIYAVLLAYGMTWPERKVLVYFLIPVKIKYLVIIFGLIEFFGTLSSASGTGGNISHIGHLGGLITGIILIYTIIRTPRKGSPKDVKKEGVIFQAMKKSRIQKKKRDIEARIKAKKIIDELLEKIARDGMSSLSPKEKKDLEWARKNYYPDGNDTMH